MKYIDYRASFKDPRWQKRRLQILERDQWKCQKCGNTEEMLVVHHKWYGNARDQESGEFRWRYPWEYEDQDLITLCDSCHQGEHEELSSIEADLVQILKQAGFMSDDMVNLATPFVGVNSEFDAKEITEVISGVLSDKHIFRKTLMLIRNKA
jgi:hypothetical protein